MKKTAVLIIILFAINAYSQEYIADTLSNSPSGLLVRFIPVSDTIAINQQIENIRQEIQIFLDDCERADKQIKQLEKKLRRLEKAKKPKEKEKEKEKVSALGYKEKY